VMQSTDRAPIALKKRVLREAALAARGAAHREAGEAAARAVADHILAADLPAEGAVAGYWPIRDELDPRSALRTLAAKGRAVALPAVARRDAPLVFRRWHPDEPLSTDALGLVAPPETAGAVMPRVVLVPVVAFDRRGHRLGYGAGYYDRTLPVLRAVGPVLALGIAYAAQEVAQVPTTALDAPLDGIVTEDGVLWSRGSSHRLGKGMDGE
jgi:5-formyltetrahydrofolate cyclo-ligase